MDKFETQIQFWKHECLKEVAKSAFNDTLLQDCLSIPNIIIPGKIPTARCCVYKERAILSERIKLAMGGNKDNPNVVEVIEIACDECPAAGFTVSDACRGCLAQRCASACQKSAIKFDHNRIAHIDKSLCIECGMCAKACPYSAISSRKRPCQNACKVKAISINPDMSAHINDEKCIQCGLCVVSCPFGAISDKSFILDAVNLIKQSRQNPQRKLFALIAPAIATQFDDCKLTQVVTALKTLGFDEVFEVALGADVVAKEEARELAEKGYLLSSCCPSFVKYVQLHHPELVEMISHNLSPMAMLGKILKEQYPDSSTVFIGPCISKKAEALKAEVKDYIDCVLTFEEMVALFDSQDISVNDLPETQLDNASFFGRMFAKSSGVINAISQSIKEQGLDIQFKAESASGLDAIKVALLKKSKNLSNSNFIEGMACTGGCINGPGCIVHKLQADKQLEAFSKTANKSILQAVEELNDKA
ncbi:MAG: monomeric [FeFe] hydrogenase [Erysipelotrichaceae bacterium]